MEPRILEDASFTPYDSSHTHSAPEKEQALTGSYQVKHHVDNLSLLHQNEKQPNCALDNDTSLSTRAVKTATECKCNALLNSTHFTSDASLKFTETYQGQFDRLDSKKLLRSQSTTKQNTEDKASYWIDSGKLHLTADGTGHYQELAKKHMNIDASKGKGNSDGSVFTVNEGDINPENLRFGIGKEAFEALIIPEYDKISSHHFNDFKADDHCLAIHSKSTRAVKAWNLRLMNKHEAVNDTFNGQPILATFCHMGGLAQIFSRKIDQQVLTFGVTGYLYSDQAINEGLFGFLLYDRNTQSLWNPFALKSVGGDLVNQTISPLSETDDDLETFVLTWQQLQENYPNAMVLLPNQTVKDTERSQFSTQPSQ